MKRFLFIGLVIGWSIQIWAQVPTITSFSPTSGVPGTQVIINGTNLGSSPVIYFGGAKGLTPSGTATSVAAFVPGGTNYMPITVTINGLTAYSNQPFNVTFPTTNVIDASSFSSAIASTNSSPRGMAFGDIDGDGKSDIMVVSYVSSKLTVFRNTNSLGAINAGNLSPFDFITGTNPNAVALGDFDGDGKLDIATANMNGGGSGVTVFQNNSAVGTVIMPVAAQFSVSGNPYNIAVADIDVDGKPDLVVVRNVSSFIRVFRNTSAGSISFDSGTDFSTGLTPTGLSIADLNADGKPEIVTTSAIPTSVSIFNNVSTTGSISLLSRVDINTGGTPTDIVLADVDTDGKPDIVVANSGTNIKLIRNQNAGGAVVNADFSGGTSFNVSGGTTQSLTVTDFDGDGKPDIAVTAGATATPVYVFRNIAVPGAITSSSLAGAADIGTNFNGVGLTAGDVDSDGKPDLIVSNQLDANLSILRNLMTVPVPAVPIANAATSVTQTGFTANWQASTFAQSYKLDVSTDNFASMLTGYNDLTVSAVSKAVSGLTQGTSYKYRIRAFNSTGVSANSNFVSVTTTTDATAPVVDSNATDVSSLTATDVTISANFSDAESGISVAYAKYRSVAGGSNNFTTVVLNKTTGTTYQGTIPGSAMTELGVEYKLQVQNGANLWNTDSLKVYTSKISYGTSQVITSYPASASGSLSTNYRIIALPFASTRTVNDVFSNTMGGYDPTVYRLFKYNGSVFVELNDNSVLKAGEGYWFIKLPSTDVYTGAGTTVDASLTDNTNCNCTGPFKLMLNSGWNQIGNPYPFKISWDDVIAANPSVDLTGNSSKIRVYRGGTTGEDVNVLRDFEGGFVSFAGSPTQIKIPVTKNPGAQSGRIGAPVHRLENSIDQPAWEIMFDVQVGDSHYRMGGIGMNPDANEGFDHHDDFNAPRFLDYLEVKFPKSIYGMTFTKDVVPTADNFAWEFNVESNLKGDASISWDNSYFGPAKELYLLDVETYQTTDMRSTDHYMFNRGTSRTFRVVYGSEDFVKSKLVPEHALLLKPYPNPFTDRVTIEFALPKEAIETNGVIEIYNGLGATVTSANTPNQSGPCRWIWESEGLGRGLYFVRLKIGSQTVTQKIIKE